MVVVTGEPIREGRERKGRWRSGVAKRLIGRRRSASALKMGRAGACVTWEWGRCGGATMREGSEFEWPNPQTTSYSKGNNFSFPIYPFFDSFHLFRSTKRPLLVLVFVFCFCVVLLLEAIIDPFLHLRLSLVWRLHSIKVLLRRNKLGYWFFWDSSQLKRNIGHVFGINIFFAILIPNGDIWEKKEKEEKQRVMHYQVRGNGLQWCLEWYYVMSGKKKWRQ